MALSLNWQLLYKLYSKIKKEITAFIVVAVLRMMKTPVLQEPTEKELWCDKAEHILLAGLCSAELLL